MGTHMKHCTVLLLAMGILAVSLFSADVPVIQASDIVVGQVNVPLRYEFGISGSGPIHVTSTGLPPGLDLMEGVLSGTPLLAGETHVTVRADNASQLAATKDILIRIGGSAKVQASLLPEVTIVPNPAEAGKPVDFAVQGKGLSGFSWIFGDGKKSGVQQPSHTYRTPGTYLVSVTYTHTNTTRVSRSEFTVVVNPPTSGQLLPKKAGGTPGTFPIALTLDKNVKSVNPFVPLMLDATPLDPTLAAIVTFTSKSSSYVAPVLASQITSTGLVVDVPPYFVKGKFGSGTVTVQVSQSAVLLSNSIKLKINGLPKPPPKLGVATASFVDIASALLTDLNSNVVGEPYDTTAFHDTVMQQLAALTQLKASIQTLSQGGGKNSMFSVGAVNDVDMPVDTKNLAVSDALVLAIMQAAGDGDTDISSAAKAWAAAMQSGTGDVTAAAAFTAAYHNLIQVQAAQRDFSAWQHAEFSLLPFRSALESLSALLNDSRFSNSNNGMGQPKVGSGPAATLTVAVLLYFNSALAEEEQRVAFDEFVNGNSQSPLFRQRRSLSANCPFRPAPPLAPLR